MLISRFTLKDTNKYPLKGTKDRFYHLATLTGGTREYICFLDRLEQQAYIEEITGGHLEFIEDSTLAAALAQFLEEQGITQISSTAWLGCERLPRYESL